MRADARRNRERIIAAARDLVLEQGPEVPLDQVAERAGVGNATLYRHFPARLPLLRSVVITDMAAVADLAEEALRSDAPAGSALRAFAARTVEGQRVAMLPILGGYMEGGPDYAEVRARLGEALDTLLARAREQGELRGDVSAADLVLFLAVLTRPLPAVSDGLGSAVRARMLSSLMDGLRPEGSTPLPGEPVGVGGISAGLVAPGGGREG
ncbi:TetR/AcrR family transcriptional regulator [Nocardiopsis sp. RSe5-2]|uniref:TetR/AcrR family transcriptional regulator n=1 Tax=Nocardiopsis endophytica TaxID=3018445 RepID=A0ABT4TWN5_9ACTN|nr:TetR/AcrR family transcriptional regulator [Nocardiopsis endophytica]MDA2809109.1 TetR/AcrR family transcriptional regulator [Nocardiopsis endophytica]